MDKTALPEKSVSAKLVLEFENNRLLPELYGEHGRNLARIEETLEVSLVDRGNKIFVTGDPHGCARAELVLNTLYHHLERGAEVTQGDVDGALRLSLDVPASPQHAAGKNMTQGATPSKDKPKSKSSTRRDADTKVKKLDDMTAIRTHRREVLPRSPRQAAYINALMNHELVVGTGPAGTGKTYLAVAAAAAMLVDGKVDRIILSRPAVEAGESLGFLPGDMRDKVDPYLRPLYDALYDMLPGPQVVRSLESGEIEIAPLAFMRGRTLSNSFVILDESQNATPMQMKMFLTRMGENSRMVITGDPSQIDLPFGAKSGLKDALEILPNIKDVQIIEFGEEDVVRHDLVTRIVKAYNKRDALLPAQQNRRRTTSKASQVSDVSETSEETKNDQT
ncbi:PhoH family protein [Alphaproteobacteria bacterium]|nr:PhoH family protein [Alphaproteobacteria bacterium]